MILHRLSCLQPEDSALRDWLLVLAAIVRATREGGKANVADIILFCFDSDDMKSLCARSLSEAAREGTSSYSCRSGARLTAFQDCPNCWKLLLRLAAKIFTSCSAGWPNVGYSRFASLWRTWNKTRYVVTGDLLNHISPLPTQRATALVWLQYLNTQDVLGLLHYLADRAEHSSAAITQEIIDDVLAASSETISHTSDAITQALPLLCRLQTLVPGASQLTSLIAAGTRTALPLCHNGFLPPRSLSEWNIASLVAWSDQRWSLRLQPIPSLPVIHGLSGDENAIEIAANLLYKQRSCRPAIATWLSSSAAQECSTDQLVKVLFAFCDSARVDDGLAVDEAMHPHFPCLVNALLDNRLLRQVRSMASDCVVRMVTSSHSHRPTYMKQLTNHLSSGAPEELSSHSMSVGIRIYEALGAETAPLAEGLLDQGLRWAGRHFAEDKPSTEDSRMTLSSIGWCPLSKTLT